MSKLLVAVLLTYIALSEAEPQRWQFTRPGKFQRQQAAPPSAPAPPASYGPPPAAAPAPSYGPPPEEPAATTTETINTTTDLSANTTKSNDTETIAKLTKPEVGVYYIYHPNGVLQKVNYLTKDDIRNMEFSAKLKYENVEPISGPIYTYDPQTRVLQRLRK